MRQGQRDEGRRVLEQSQSLREEPARKAGGMSAEEFDLTRTRVNCAGAILYAAQLCVSHQDLRHGEQLGRMAVDLDAKNLPARLFLMSLYEQMDQKDAALEVCLETVAADPENPDLLWRLGILQSQVGKFAAAADTFRTVDPMRPESGTRLWLSGGGLLADGTGHQRGIESGPRIRTARTCRSTLRVAGTCLRQVGPVSTKRDLPWTKPSGWNLTTQRMRAYRDQLPNGPR